MKELELGIQSYYRAWAFVREQQLKSVFWWSVAGYLFVLLFSLWGVWQLSAQVIEWIASLSWIQSTFSWASKWPWLSQILRLLFFLSIGLLYLSIFKYIYLVLASPLYAYISERTASSYSGKRFQFSLPQFLSDIIRGIRLSLINLFRQTFFSVFLFFLSFIPVVGIFFSLMIILLDSYYYGFSMLDYNCERDRLSVSRARTFIREHRGLALGNGLPFYFSIMVPVIGVCLMAPLSCIAATLSYEHLKTSYGNR